MSGNKKSGSLGGSQSKIPSKQSLKQKDFALWEHVKSSVSPLEGRQKYLQTPLKKPKTIGKQKKNAENVALPQSTPVDATPVLSKMSQSFRLEGTHKADWQLTTKKDPNFTSIEKNIKKKLSRGQKPVEAVLDLHGMTQEHAHNSLKSFIHRCRRSGLRHVIVVTGKGTSAPDDPYRRRGAMGVLRQNLPIWLSSADLKPAIVGYEQAPQHHGGAGAFYVHIRRLDR